MHEFRRTNKITGVHWLKNPIENLKISIKLRPQDGIISLPKFEEYAQETNGLSAETFDKTNEHTFKWQEKSFSLWEVQRYSDVHNCITENELAYNDILNNVDTVPSKVFTYIHDDYRLPLPAEVTKKKGMFDLETCFEKFNITEKIEWVFVQETSSMGLLFRSEEDLDFVEEKWIAMHVAFDSSDYNEDSQLVFKQEAILLSLYHNITQNYLLVSPDSNHLELNPYSVETEAGVPLGYQYSVGVEFDEGESEEDLSLLLNKLHKKWEKKHKYLVNFSMPALGTRTHYVILEVLSAAGFEGDDLYIEFNIKLPDGIRCNDPLQGSTHATRIMRSEDVEQWSFGHVAEFTLETDIASEPAPIQIFFEAISTDWWGRHRTEGYCHLALPLQPGSTCRELACSRPEEADRVEAESRRFFVGGCHLIKDLDVVAKPQCQDTTFTYTSTGSIHVRSHVVSQAATAAAAAAVAAAAATATATTHASGACVLQGAAAALRHYRRARARLARAAAGLSRRRHDTRGSGDGDTGQL